MNDNYNESWISLAEAAEHLDVTKDSIRNWIKKRIYPLIKLESCGSLRNPSLTSGSKVVKVHWANFADKKCHR